MKKTTLNFIFFFALLVTSTKSMPMFKKQHQHKVEVLTTKVDTSSSKHAKDENLSKLLEKECPICFEEVPIGSFFKLNCKHKFCKHCLQDIINTASKKGLVPLCSICRTTISNTDCKKLNSNSPSTSVSHTNFSVDNALKILIIPSCLAAYSLYRYLSRKKTVTVPTDENKQSIQSCLSKKISSVKKILLDHTSDIIVTSLASTGLFIVLTKSSVNLGLPLNRYAYNKLGSTYWKIMSFFNQYPYLGLIKNQFDNGNLINASLSVAGGLLIRYVYKLLDGTSYKPKKKPPFVDSKTGTNNANTKA